MNTPRPPSQPAQPPQSHSVVPDAQAWENLLGELSELHARLQYLKLMLKLGVERF